MQNVMSQGVKQPLDLHKLFILACSLILPTYLRQRQVFQFSKMQVEAIRIQIKSIETILMYQHFFYVSQFLSGSSNAALILSQPMLVKRKYFPINPFGSSSAADEAVVNVNSAL